MLRYMLASANGPMNQESSLSRSGSATKMAAKSGGSMCGLMSTSNFRVNLVEFHGHSKPTNVADPVSLVEHSCADRSPVSTSCNKNANGSKSTLNCAQSHMAAQQQNSNSQSPRTPALVLVKSDSNLNSTGSQNDDESNCPAPSQLSQLSESEAVNVTFTLAIPDHNLTWHGLIWRRDLYLHVPAGIAIDRSKEAFVTLLEFAEEQLMCKSVVVCFAKDLPERNTLMRMFMFFGFELLAPNHQLVLKDAPDDSIYMAYQIG
ncbi:Ornithine decarboxylase antizyme 1 [Halotydeus destructor]|nr:Ornithine decarboxylase antizyme 1 [Halotydeus destructor]